jgi:CheY-like chemotaxis protein
MVDETDNLAGVRILLAEDNDINAEIAMELLTLQQVYVERVADERQAVEQFAGHPEGDYDLILMDINIPVLNGLKATEEIRWMDRADAHDVPNLAMTANTFQEDREQAESAGMNAFLSKPFTVEQLYHSIREFVAQT